MSRLARILRDVAWRHGIDLRDDGDSLEALAAEILEEIGEEVGYAIAREPGEYFMGVRHRSVQIRGADAYEPPPYATHRLLAVPLEEPSPAEEGGG